MKISLLLSRVYHHEFPEVYVRLLKVLKDGLILYQQQTLPNVIIYIVSELFDPVAVIAFMKGYGFCRGEKSMRKVLALLTCLFHLSPIVVFGETMDDVLERGVLFFKKYT